LYKHVLDKPIGDDIAPVKAKKRRRPPVVMTKSEVHQVLNQMKGKHSCRPGAHGACRCEEAKPKTIPINRHVKAVLDRLPRAIHHDFVVTYTGKPIKQKDGYKRSFRTACKKAGIPCGRKTPNGITFHDLRRTVKTNMLSAGASKIYCDLILGHSLQGMDVHYVVPDDETLRQAMAKYTDWLDDKIAHALASVDQTVDHERKGG
jgi:integrase